MEAGKQVAQVQDISGNGCGTGLNCAQNHWLSGENQDWVETSKESDCVLVALVYLWIICLLFSIFRMFYFQHYHSPHVLFIMLSFCNLDSNNLGANWHCNQLPHDMIGGPCYFLWISWRDNDSKGAAESREHAARVYSVTFSGRNTSWALIFCLICIPWFSIVLINKAHSWAWTQALETL